MVHFSRGALAVVSSSTILFLSSAAVVEACGTTAGESSPGTVDGGDGSVAPRDGAGDGASTQSDSAVSSSDGGGSPQDGGSGSLDGGSGSPNDGWFPAYNPDAQAGCTGGGEAQEFAPCTAMTGCQCGLMSCVNDPTLNDCGIALGTVCEYRCTQDSDCISFDSHCVGGTCAPALCGGDTGNGTYGGTCTVKSPGDGTCIPMLLQASSGSLGPGPGGPGPGGPGPQSDSGSTPVEVGYCIQGGTSTTGCVSQATATGVDLSIGIDRTNAGPSDLCAPGSICNTTFAFGAAWSRCGQSCYPPTPSDPACPSGDSCLGIPGGCVDASSPVGPVCTPIRGGCCPDGGCPPPTGSE
jgi:hypothetical protein